LHFQTLVAAKAVPEVWTQMAATSQLIRCASTPPAVTELKRQVMHTEHQAQAQQQEAQVADSALWDVQVGQEELPELLATVRPEASLAVVMVVVAAMMHLLL
jgi:hypothetical protein